MVKCSCCNRNPKIEKINNDESLGYGKKVNSNKFIYRIYCICKDNPVSVTNSNKSKAIKLWNDLNRS